MSETSGTEGAAEMREATPSQGHETLDVRLRPIMTLAIGLAALILIGAGVAWALFALFFARSAERVDVPSPFSDATREAHRPLPPSHPGAQLEHLRAHEKRQLEGYGWVDREAGTVRIPVERAMEILVERAGGRGEKGEGDGEGEGNGSGDGTGVGVGGGESNGDGVDGDRGGAKESDRAEEAAR